MLTYLNDYIGIQVVSCVLIAFIEDKREILYQNLGKPSCRENQRPVPTGLKSYKKTFFYQNFEEKNETCCD